MFSDDDFYRFLIPIIIILTIGINIGFAIAAKTGV